MEDRDITIERSKLKETAVDIGGRDLLIAIGEVSFRRSSKDAEPDLDAKLNARLPSYILPAIQIAKMQEKRPRFFLVSGVNFALRWNARTGIERKVMLMNTSLKTDMIKKFITHFFPETFSLVEPIVSQDILKVSEKKILALWELLERKHPEQAKELVKILKQFTRLDEDKNESIHRVLGYAVGHLFAMGDINFEGNYIHNPIGYASIGGEKEIIFNRVRKLLSPLIQDFTEVIFERGVITKDNMRIVVTTKENVPPPYNGFFKENSGSLTTSLEEVTYENERPFSFYEEHGRLYEDIEYIYDVVGKEEYKNFWDSYQKRYIDLKSRYQEAYQISE